MRALLRWLFRRDGQSLRRLELAGVREQNARIKTALRRWQSRQAQTAYELARR
ncbi:hypothetical protein I0C86_23280 [Plantactinospora sp. S1510]|uniref:Uncharacterized protein n=1 Tax=Plantactinospora alkalitolerans TaxID=2789879 RepID=A0ABS0H0K3_9ACTN|nr:hypothetical protein [Plantactinospora alkalitolerans]MBF9131864.1 hypothetical protein [Plantactinospora alkalitolerans]